MIYDRDGRTFEIKAKEKQVEEIMTILYDKAPWAVSGYSDELQKLWQKERQTLIAAVDERRSAAGSVGWPIDRRGTWWRCVALRDNTSYVGCVSASAKRIATKFITSSSHIVFSNCSSASIRFI
jgi:hypothetical protein